MRSLFGLLATSVLLCCGIGCISPPANSTAQERWDKDLQRFEALDNEQPPPTGAVLFVGSSSIRRWESLASDFPESSVINRGFGGSQMSDLLALVDRLVLPYRPAVVVVYEGDNDLNKGRSPHEVATDFQTFCEWVHRELPTTHIAFLAIKPSIKRRHLMEEGAAANDLVARYALGEMRVSVVDIYQPMLDASGEPDPAWFAEDLLHLNESGYALWAGLVRAHLRHLKIHD